MGGQRKLLPRLLTHPDSGLATAGHKLIHARIVAFLRHQHAVKAAPSGLQSFFNRMHAIQDFHEG